MAERKVLNKYYDPEYDPKKIPRKSDLSKNTQWNIRTMTPCSMRCSNCGEYIYKAKKFNSRMETVKEKTYLGINIHRFYIKCPRCLAEISYTTDPENGDYTLESGATRNYESVHLTEKLEEKERMLTEESEKMNPLRVIEKRMEASNREMKTLEDLEELQNMNHRKDSVDPDSVIKMVREKHSTLKRKQMMEDEAVIESIFRKDTIKRLPDDPVNEIVEKKRVKKEQDPKNSSSREEINVLKKETWQCSIGGLSHSKAGLKMLIKKKKAESS